MRIRSSLGAPVGVLAVLGLATSAFAREPGIAPVLPPGLTMGLPIAVNPPPGLYFMNRSGYASYQLKDDDGNNIGQKATIITDSMQLTWVPGVEFLGGSYKAFVMVPFVHQDMTRSTRTTGPLGNWTKLAMGNPKVQPLDLTWKLGNGWNVGAGVGFYAPLGQYDKDAPINIGANFWTLESSLGLTYLDDKWHGSLQVVHNTNTRNHDNDYKSGDQIFVNATLTHKFGEWDIGPVAYYQKQITSDSNQGGRATFGGRVFDKPEQVGVGGLVGRQVGKVRLTAMLTRDVEAENTMAGTKLWFNVLYKF